MQLASGARLGPYEILSAIGAGGMGEVYKARDTRLNRIVAVKISKDRFSERFQREARAVAALNHPHICTLHDVGENYLVMEYIEGQPLAGPLPLHQAVRYGAQIAAALAEAHGRGIIHRDLKPANILVTKTGVKMLDFGLAKINAAGKSGTPEETETVPLTKENTILGTLQYMAPEQLEGKEADSRSDIFALGLVLYEAIAGRRAFEASSQASLIAAILKEQPPPLPEVPQDSPLNRVLGACLAKDPEKRWQSAADLQMELVWILEYRPPSPAPKSKRNLWAIPAAVLLATALAVAAWYLRPSLSQTHSMQLQLNAPAETELRSEDVAISPDGRMLAFVAGSLVNRLWIRNLDSANARELPGTDGAYLPFWSPDQRSLGFFAQGKVKRIDLSGDRIGTLADAPSGRGGTWNRDNIVLFSAATNGPIWKVSALGGTPVTATTVNAPSEASHRFPIFLPDGRHFLFYVRAGAAEVRGIYIASLDDSKQKTRVIETDFTGVYSPPYANRPGELLWMNYEGSAIAQPFDGTKRRLSGAPTLVTDVGPLRSSYDRYTPLSVSNDGILVYGAGARWRQLTWCDRKGKAVGLLGEPSIFGSIRISADGKRVAAEHINSASGAHDIWTMGVTGGDWTRVTVGGGGGLLAWSPDGQRIAYATGGTRTGTRATVHAISSAGGGVPERLTNTPHSETVNDWSPDGKFLLYTETSTQADLDLWVLPMMGGRKPFPYLQTPFQESGGRFSPDGKWIAYVSNESGRQEVYVRAFPSGEMRQQVSVNGGAAPVWRRDGKELFYQSLGSLMAVALEPSGGSLRFTSPQTLFPMQAGPYDVSPDGRFLIVAATRGPEPPSLTVLLDWQGKLEKRP